MPWSIISPSLYVLYPVHNKFARPSCHPPSTKHPALRKALAAICGWTGSENWQLRTKLSWWFLAIESTSPREPCKQTTLLPAVVCAPGLSVGENQRKGLKVDPSAKLFSNSCVKLTKRNSFFNLVSLNRGYCSFDLSFLWGYKGRLVYLKCPAVAVTFVDIRSQKLGQWSVFLKTKHENFTGIRVTTVFYMLSCLQLWAIFLESGWPLTT